MGCGVRVQLAHGEAVEEHPAVARIKRFKNEPSDGTIGAEDHGCESPRHQVVGGDEEVGQGATTDQSYGSLHRVSDTGITPVGKFQFVIGPSHGREVGGDLAGPGAVDVQGVVA